MVLNWNGMALLKQYLPSVVAQLPDYAKVVLLDNASTDDSVGFVRREFPMVEVVINDQNYGFAQGYNRGLSKIDAEYLVLLNSDVECAGGWIEPVVDFMDENQQVAACQPKILDDKSRGNFEYAGASGGFVDVLGFPFCRGRIFNDVEQDLGQYEEPISVFWATGACLFIRKRVFEEVEGFDEDFFAHMEEIDLCWRVLRAGYKIYCIPESKVYHLGGGTLKKLNPQKTYLNFRNNLIMIIKNDHQRSFLLMLFLKLVLDGVAALKFVAEGNPMHAWSVVKAHFYVYFHMKTTYRKRKELEVAYPEGVALPVYGSSIVMSRYLLGKKSFNELKFNTQ